MKLARMLKIYRASNGQDQKAVAAEIGMNASTYCRIEAGKSVDLANFIKLLSWLFDADEQQEGSKENGTHN